MSPPFLACYDPHSQPHSARGSKLRGADGLVVTDLGFIEVDDIPNGIEILAVPSV
jgi:hypothetical protein